MIKAITAKIEKMAVQIKVAISCLILGQFLLILSGCGMPEKNTLNPVVHSPEFIDAIKGRSIRLIAPASGTDPVKIEQIKSFGHLNIQVPDNLMEQAVAYHSNSDEIRYQQLKTALFDKSNKTVIWTLRGGYGAARLIEKLEKLPVPKQEKIFIGHSDITALHLFLTQRWGWKTIHGSGLAELVNPDKDPQNLQKVADIIARKVKVAKLDGLKPLNQVAKNLAKKGLKVSGRLTGGNLSIIQTSLGTNWQLKTAGQIVFLEDIGEKGYRIDRTFNHLRQAGLFDKAKAVILGDFTSPQDEHVDTAIARFANELNIPVFKTEQFGHGRVNYPLLYQSKSEIVLSKEEHAENSKNISKNTGADPTDKMGKGDAPSLFELRMYLSPK